MKSQEIKTGDKVRVIVEVWREDEQPSIRNFYTGKITEIVERTKHCFYVKIQGLDKLIPIDRVTVASAA